MKLDEIKERCKKGGDMVSKKEVRWLITELEKVTTERDRMKEAADLYRFASIQSHSGHWDSTMQHGAGCPECIRARELREKADALKEGR